MQQPRLKLFVFEFITGGGLSDTLLPESLLKEGVMMRDALLQDLEKLDQFSLLTMHDARVKHEFSMMQSVEVKANSFESTFKTTLQQADLVWIIAPESDGVLQRLSQYCREAQRLLLGCGEAAVRVTSNKLLSANWLSDAHIMHLPSITIDAWHRRNERQFASWTLGNDLHWIVKPIDGVGCEGVQWFVDDLAVDEWLQQAKTAQQHMIQPYHQGVAGSISMLCCDGRGWLLSCNAQHIQQKNGALVLTAITINGLIQYWTPLQVLCDDIAKMLPDAKGYIGVDVMIDVIHNTISVIEINPRLTTSYVALSQATGTNVAGLVIDCIRNDRFVMPTIEKNKVKINL